MDTKEPTHLSRPGQGAKVGQNFMDSPWSLGDTHDHCRPVVWYLFGRRACRKLRCIYFMLLFVCLFGSGRLFGGFACSFIFLDFWIFYLFGFCSRFVMNDFFIFTFCLQSLRFLKLCSILVPEPF